MKEYDVYGSNDDNCYFSNGIMRDFGQNKMVKLDNKNSILTVVMPLTCNPEECGLIKVGTIMIDYEG